MTNIPQDFPVRGAIQWEFSLDSSAGRVRYGKVNWFYFKQFLPGGIEDPVNHPPKRVLFKMYDLASRQAGRGPAL